MSERRVAPEWLTRWEYAHRGLHEPGVPENSIGGAEQAIAAGMGIECDIQLSRDGVPMVFHDWELERLTERQGLFADLDADELQEIGLLQTVQTIPRFEDFLTVIAGRAPLLIEIKSKPGYNVTASCSAVSEALRNYSGEHAVMSFDPRVGGWFFKHDRTKVRGLVGTDTLDLGFREAWRAAGSIEQAHPDFLAIDVRDLPNSITSMWRETGRPLFSWTVRSPKLRQQARDHADALISEGAGLA